MTSNDNQTTSEILPQQTKSRAGRRLLWVAVTVGVIIIVGGIGRNLGGVAAKMGAGEQAEKTKAAIAAREAREAAAWVWEKRTIAGLSMESPFSFAAAKDLHSQLPPETRDQTVFLRLYESDKPVWPRISIVEGMYKPDVAADLNDAVEGAMRKAAAVTGDTKPEFISRTIFIDGAEARRVHYSGTYRGESFYLDSVFCLRGQSTWQVMAATAGSGNVDAERILDSVHIE